MVKREGLVICLEELPPARGQAMRRFGEAARRAGISTLRLGQATGPAPHAFMPDLDLRCSVRGCSFGPEQHG